MQEKSKRRRKDLFLRRERKAGDRVREREWRQTVFFVHVAHPSSDIYKPCNPHFFSTCAPLCV